MAEITADDVKDAARCLAGRAVRTPLLENIALNEQVGGRVFIKPEILQHYGSFKFRGAFNLLASLDGETRKRGVVAWSSGNHAQGVASAARIFSIPATIVMPADAPRIKSDMVRALGASIVTYDRARDDREAIAHDIAQRTGATIAPSYDHPKIIAGQGTVGLEIAEDVAAQSLTLDAAVICCGGGGLAAGSALALRSFMPAIDIVTAEPANFDDTARSLETGTRQSADVTLPTICDAIATPRPGALTFPILKAVNARGVSVSEDEVVDAMRFAFNRLKLVVEPGGAVALAAVLSGKVPARGRHVAITLSGGNVDPDVFSNLIHNGAIN